MTLTEAFLAARGRRALPTALSTAAMRARFRADVLRRSVISARTASLPYLSIMADVIGDLLATQVNSGRSIGSAEAHLYLKQALEVLQYDPEGGHFGLPADANIPKAKKGSLQDLSSDQRIDLIIKTQKLLWQSAAQNTKAKEPERLTYWPAWELIRSHAREPRQDWEQRWKTAGGELYEGRMIAAVGSPIWQKLGDSGRWEDALGTDTPPFAFGSTRGWIAVGRRECIRLGVPFPGSPGPQPKGKPVPEPVPVPPPNIVPLTHDIPAAKVTLLETANPEVAQRVAITLQLSPTELGMPLQEALEKIRRKRAAANPPTA